MLLSQCLIFTGAGHKASHNIYIWDRESGGLVKILEGPKDPLEDLDVRFFFFHTSSKCVS